ncbi:MAG: hypothetical protein IKJ24_02470 [Clostridia bacterium]|nr:hypothetical protein [Clostridia bacterium]
MTVYISRKAKWKINIGVYYEDARNFLLWILGGLALVAIALASVCIYLNSQFTRVNIEAGEYISASDILGEGAQFGSDFDPDSINHAGVYYFTVEKGGERETVRLAVKDTKAPEITVKNVYFAVNRTGGGEVYYPSPMDFIDTVYEPDDFWGEYLSELPDPKKLGTHEVEIRFTDASGNKTEIFKVQMTQISDNQPPEMETSELIVTPLGAPIEYTPYVTLSDNCTGELYIEVDESELLLDTVGEYHVYIVGSDRVGNKTAPVRVTVKVVEAYDEDRLDEMLDGMTDKLDAEGKSREQICRDIYKLVRKTLVYTGDSQKSDEESAAYYALMGGGGDCYSYYSLTKLLLDRCGIENMGIERIGGSGEGTHFWNFVNIGEGEDARWYHLDTTPLIIDRYDHSGCLLTEVQINAYSKARRDFYKYDKNGYPTASEEIITPTRTLEEFY